MFKPGRPVVRTVLSKLRALPNGLRPTRHSLGEDEIGKPINDVPAFLEELTVIGHSWGAATAARVVSEGNRVEKLVTVDPLSWRRPDYSKVAEHSGSWHNYDSVSTSWDLSNIVAWWGRRWDDAPEPFADSHTRVDLDHDEICSRHCVPP